jgi:tRNA dimethylallyltransferase
MQARQKRVCPTCTLDPTRPILLEEGREWEVHRKTRAHRRLEGKEQRLKEVEEKRREKARRDEEKDKAGKDKEDSPNESLSSIDILY